MNPYLPSPTINPTDGFTDSDTFAVRRAARGLTNIVGSLTRHAVVLVDGPWGSGKTTFVRQWQRYLAHRGHPVIYWDAFQADHHEDAFFPMFAALLDELEQAKLSANQTQKLRKALCQQAKLIVDSLPGVLWDVVSLLEPTTQAGKIAVTLFGHLRPGLGSPNQTDTDYFQNSLTRVKAETKSIDEFRKQLSKTVTNMVQPAGKRKPLVFVVDELDRCKPSFALNVLERIKHIFPSDGVCFVLVTHLPELAAMVRHAYGLIDAERYLDKFYQLRIDIESLLTSGGVNIHRRYIEYLSAQMIIGRQDDGGNAFTNLMQANSFVKPTLDNLAVKHGIHLRMLERVVLNFLLYLKVDRVASIEMATHLAAGLCVMRLVSPKKYEQVKENRLTFASATEFLGLEEWKCGERDRVGVEAWWRLVTVDDEGNVTDTVKKEMANVRRLFDQAVPSGHPRLGGITIEKLLGSIRTDIDLFWQT